MKIAHVITTLETGGAETSLLRLLSAQPAAATRSMVSAMLDGPLATEVRRLGVPVQIIPVQQAWQAPGGVARLASVLRTFAPDVVHGWMYHGSVMAQAAAGLARLHVPVVWGIRHSLDDLSTESRTTARLIHLMAHVSARPRRIVYNSRRSAAQHEAAGYDRSRTAVVPNGFDADAFRPSPDARHAVRRELGIADDVPVIGLVARYHRIKDHETFLRAAKALAVSGSDAHFVLAGRGTNGPVLAERVGAFGLTPRVHCLGERRDIARLTAAFDVATCCSLGESFPNAIGEAMACGVPCVTTDVGDAADVVGDTGRVIATRDVPALVRAWQDLLEASPAYRQQLGSAVRERILGRFSLAFVAAEYDAIYANLVRRQV